MSRWKLAACGGLLALALLGAYSNHFHNEFHFDDWHTVGENLYIRDIRNIPKFFADASTFSVLPTHENYRPVVSTTLAIDYKLAGGLNPTWFHIDTFIWYLALLAAIYFMYLHLMERAQPDPRNGYYALFAAGLFGLHPACAETVNYVVQRGEIQSTFGVVAGLVVYMYWPNARKWGAYLAPVIIGTLAKPPALMFTPVLAAYIYLFESGSRDRTTARARIGYSLRSIVPALAASAGLILLQILMTPKTWEGGASSRYEYWLTQPSVIVHYIKTFFIPTELTADTDRSVVTRFLSETSIESLALIALIVAALRPALKRPDMRPAAFGASWFALAVLPTSIQPLAEVDNDHRMFFPFVGLTLAACWVAFRWLSRFLDKRSAADSPQPSKVWTAVSAAIGLIILAACGWGTYQRNAVWRSEESLWKDVTEKSPHNGRGLMNYGLVLMERGDYQGALDYYRDAENYTPEYSTLKTNEGIAYGALGDEAEAESHFDESISLAPDDPQANFFFGQWLEQQKRLPEAREKISLAVQFNPAYAEARDLLMQIYSEQGDAAALKDLASETLRLFPADTTAAGFLSSGPKPVPDVADGTPTEPSTPEDFLNLSLIYERQGRHEDCIQAANQALKLRPNYAEAYNNIAAAYQSMGRWDEAIHAAEQAVRLKPDFQLAKNNLQYALNQKRQHSAQK